MSLQSEFGNEYSDESINRFSKKLLDKYGELACKEAAILDETGLSEGSKTTYKPHVRKVISELGHENPSIEETIKVIKGLERSGSTKGTMVSSLKKYFEIKGDIAKSEEFQKEAKHSDIASDAFTGKMEVEDWVTDKEFKRIDSELMPDDSERQRRMSSANKEWIITLEHKAIFETLYYTGCRVSEICMLNVEDVDLDSNEARVYRLKKKDGVKRDMIALPQEYVDTLSAYLDEYDITEGNIFNYSSKTIQNRITDIDKLAKYTYGEFEHTDKLTPHKLRHARVTAIANNSNIDKAGEFVGHASLETTKAYRHLTTESQREILPEESDDGGIEELISSLSEDEIKKIAQEKDIEL